MPLPSLQQAPWFNNSNTGVANQTATAGSPSVAGDIIVLVVEWGAQNQTISISDNAAGGSNTYQLVQNGQTAGGNNTAIFVATNIRLPASGNLAITVHYSGNSAHNLITAIELSGVLSYSGVDLLGNISIVVGSAATTFPQNLNLLSNLEFLVAAIHSDTGGGVLTANAGWTVASSNTSNTKGVLYSTSNAAAPLSITVNPVTSSVAVAPVLIIVALAFSPAVQPITPVAITKIAGRYVPQGLLSLQNYKGSLYSDLAWIGQTASDPGWLLPGITGMKLRIHWNDIQPTNASGYDWAYLDAVFAMANATGKIIGINVVMGTSAPSWVFAPPYNCSQFTFSGFSTPAPPPWDTTFQQIISAFFQTLFARYGSNPLFSYVELTGMGRGNQAGDWCQSNADNTELQNAAVAHGYSPAGWGVAIWVAGTDAIGPISAAALPGISIIFTKGAPVYFQDSTGYFTALNQLIVSMGWQIGIKDNALDNGYNATGQQPTVPYIIQYHPTNPCGFQRNFAATSSSEWLQSMANALSWGSHFIEIYPSEEPLIGAAQLAITNQQFLQSARVLTPLPPPENGPQLFPPYAGQAQQQVIPVPAKTAYQGWDGEEGPWVMPPYSQIFGYNSQADATEQAWVPPPVKQTDIFTAQQTWPL